MAQQSQPLRAEDLHVSPARARKQRILRGLFFVAASLAIFISLGIVLALLRESITFITNVDLASLVNGIWEPRSLRFDIPTLIAGSVVIALIGMLIAAPLGLGAAIYLAEYASPRVRGWLKPILEILAAIPSVVLGFFALTGPQPDHHRPHLPRTDDPLQHALGGHRRGHPHHAARGQRSPRTRCTRSPAPCARPRTASGPASARPPSGSSFPAAVSGIVAALIIGLSRAIGETMIVAIAAGGTGGAVFNLNPCLPGQTMTAAMIVAGHRLRPVSRWRGQPALREPLLRRPAALRHDPRAEPRQRALRAPGPPEGSHLMAGRLARLGQPARGHRGGAARAGGQATDWRSRAWEAFLVVSLVISFAFLIWLLVSIFIELAAGLAGARRRGLPLHAAGLEPREGRHRAGPLRLLRADGHRRAPGPAGRHRRRRLPRGVRAGQRA